MILFDVYSLPKGIDIGLWHDLFMEGICIYDSKEPGEKPFQFDGKISLIDVREMTQGDMAKIANHIDNFHKEYEGMTEKENNLVRENNRKLVEYLKEINNGK